MLILRVEGSKIVLQGDTRGILVRFGDIELNAPNGLSIDLGQSASGLTDLEGSERSYETKQLAAASRDEKLDRELSFAKRLAMAHSMHRKPGLAAHEYLRMILDTAGKPLRVSDLLDYLPFTAYKGKAKSRANSANSVRSALVRRPDVFVKIDSSWGLVGRDDSFLEE